MESEWQQSKKRFWFVLFIMGRDGAAVECGPCVVVRKIFLYFFVFGGVNVIGGMCGISVLLVDFGTDGGGRGR